MSEELDCAANGKIIRSSIAGPDKLQLHLSILENMTRKIYKTRPLSFSNSTQKTHKLSGRNKKYIVAAIPSTVRSSRRVVPLAPMRVCNTDYAIVDCEN